MAACSFGGATQITAELICDKTGVQSLDICALLGMEMARRARPGGVE
jgi:hypothetical protein